MLGFGESEGTPPILDGREVETIHSDLTAAVDVTKARRLPERRKLAFMGDTKGGPFEVSESTALQILSLPNPHGRPNSDVLLPWINGRDITGRSRACWIVDFPESLSLNEASRYEAPFAFIEEHVRPARDRSRSTIDSWWLHERTRGEMRAALEPLSSFVATPRVTKHRLFVLVPQIILPDSQVIAFSTDSLFDLGLLQSRVHEVWARAKGTQVRERESGFRYTPTTCFETFALPSQIEQHREDIATAARELVNLRDNWLNPSEWVHQEVLAFPGSADGRWSRYLQEPDERGIGTVHYPRIVPRDEDAASKLATRTLTNLYNERPTWLNQAHRKLDEAVFASYGWSVDLSDDQILKRLLALNLKLANE